MKRVAVAVLGTEADDFREWLHDRRQVQLVGWREEASRDLPASPRGMSIDTREAEAAASALDRVRAFCLQFAEEKPGFVEGIFPVMINTTGPEVDRVARSLDWRALSAQVDAIRGRLRDAEEGAEALRAEAKALEPLASVSVPPSRLRRGLWVRVALVRVAEAQADGLVTDAEVRRLAQIQQGQVASGEASFGVAYRTADEDALRGAVARLGGKLERLPDLDVPIGQAIADRRARAAALDTDARSIRAEAGVLARQQREVEIALAYWQSEVRKGREVSRIARTQRMCVAGGFIRADDAPGFEAAFKERFPRSAIELVDPVRGEDVPVSVKLSGALRPLRLLIDMYGQPSYWGFDPTPYLAFVFLTFFGMMYGDVVYGLMLIGVATYFYRRFAGQPHLQAFFSLFGYCGVSAMFFGALTGAWASDLADPKYLGEGNPLQAVRNAFWVFDPLKDPIVALLIVVGIGIANQYYGMSLRMYRDLRRGDWQGALFDGLLWMVFLTAVTILVSQLFVTVPAALFQGATLVAVLGALGLVLTQGRAETGFGAKAITGVISLYGILGTYGVASFVGDVLSYSRILALGLTTSIVGASFNIIADLVRDIPGVGIVLFVLVLVFGHIFNFVMSILGAFVHGARLIFLEFFGRFYESSANRFEPFGFNSDRVALSDR